MWHGPWLNVIRLHKLCARNWNSNQQIAIMAKLLSADSNTDVSLAMIIILKT
jgi:hypothetical protein